MPKIIFVGNFRRRFFIFQDQLYISAANRSEICRQWNFAVHDSVYKVILTRKYCHCFCVPKIVAEMIVTGRFLLFEQVYILMKEALLIIILLFVHMILRASEMN